MRLLCPLQPAYLNNGHTCMINQLFGQNPNALFYGPEGHTGIDIDTTSDVKYEVTNDGNGSWEWNGENWGPHARWRRIERTPQERNGRIPIVACHDGELSPILNDDKQGKGWGVFLTAEPEMEPENKEVQYRTLYWHIETPWNSLQTFWGLIKSIPELIKAFSKRQVKAGAIIAIAGNNGYSTGPHLHLSLDKREKVNGVWGAWDRIDPMPYLGSRSQLVAYQDYKMTSSDFYYLGKKITLQEYKALIKDWPKLI